MKIDLWEAHTHHMENQFSGGLKYLASFGSLFLFFGVLYFLLGIKVFGSVVGVIGIWAWWGVIYNWIRNYEILWFIESHDHSLMWRRYKLKNRKEESPALIALLEKKHRPTPEEIQKVICEEKRRKVKEDKENP